MQKNSKSIKKTDSSRRYLTYQNMFFIFMIGNILGFVLEGFFCLFKYGKWESHVVTIWGPLCLIYGIGLVVFYISAVLLKGKNIFIQFIVIGLVTSGLELLCGLLLEFGMGMRAWNYSRHFLNIRGHISLKMTFVWGLFGVAFAFFAVKPLDKFFELIKGKTSKIICAVLSVFMFINLSATLGCMVRWKQRHDEISSKTKIGKTIDRIYDDERMAKRFVEWRFLENKNTEIIDDEIELKFN